MRIESGRKAAANAPAGGAPVANDGSSAGQPLGRGVGGAAGGGGGDLCSLVSVLPIPGASNPG